MDTIVKTMGNNAMPFIQLYIQYNEFTEELAAG